MRWLPLLVFLAATPAFAQDEPGFLERLFGTDTAESDAEQGSLLERLIEDSLSDAGRAVTVTGFQGALSGQATLESLTIADADGTWLTLTDATLDWNRAALFAGRLEVAELSAQEILLPRLATPADSVTPSPEARRFQLPDLPVSVNIGRIAAERVELGEALFGVEAVISLDGSLSLAGGNGAADLDVVRLDQPGAIRLDAGYQNATENLRLDLSMVEGEGGIIATLAGLPGTPSVDFAIEGDAPLSDFTANIRLATDGEERLTGQVLLGETENAWRITAQIGGDIAPVFAPQFGGFFGDNLTLEAEALLHKDGRTVVPEFSLFARELALFGSVEIGADRLPQKIDITGRIAPEDGNTVLLPIAGIETRVARANLAVQFNAEESEDYRTVIRLDTLTRNGLAAEEVALRTTGRIGAGTPPDISGDVNFDVAGFATDDGLSDALGPDLSGNATVRWSGGPVMVNRFSLEARDLLAQGAATIDGDAIRATTSLSARRLANFAALANRPLSGQATLDAEGTINPLTQAFDVVAKGQTTNLAIGEPRADAIFAGTAQLDMSATRDTDGLRIDLTSLEGNAARLTGQASLRSGGSSATLEGQLNDTALLLPGVTGASEVTFSGQEDQARDWTLSTTLASPALSAELAGLLSNIYDLPTFQGTIRANSSDLSAFSELAGRALTGQLSVNAEGGANADLTRILINGTLNGRNVSVGDTRFDPLLSGDVTLDVEGGRTDDRVDIVSFVLNGQALTANVAGTVTALSDIPAFEGTIEANSPDLGVFSGLAERPLSGSVELTADGAASADLTMVQLNGDLTGQDISVGLAEVDALLRGPLALNIETDRETDRIEISAFSLTTNALTAETSGQLGAEGDRLALRARLNDVAPFVPGFSGAVAVDGTLGRTGESIAVDIDASGPGGSQAAIDGTITQDFASANLGFNGTAPLALANRFIAPRSLAGTSRFDLRLQGRPALENLAGQVTLSDARLAAPTLPTSLEDISGRIDLAGAQATLDIDSRVQSGGRIVLSGPIGLTAPNSAALSINLSSVRVTDSQLYETVADGQIRVDGPLTGGAAIAGTIDLGETNIRIPSSGLGGAGAIPEITHLREPPPVRGTRRRAGLLDRDANGARSGGPVYPLDIRVSAPNRIFLRGRGLDSEFGGALRVTGTTANVIPIGAFELIRGRLDILGNRLDLEQAGITVQGEFIPVLDIRASTDVEDTEVNVEVLGPADNPEVRFTSAPELPQEEVLARLIFGRGLETLSPLQAARLAIAVRTLAGRGGEGIVGNIRGTAGLADLDVTTNEDGNAAVRAGAYLGENVYSDVTVDSTGETELNLNLDVSPSLTVRGGVTNEGETSLGIFFERDY